jgi:hypothetical protein
LKKPVVESWDVGNWFGSSGGRSGNGVALHPHQICGWSCSGALAGKNTNRNTNRPLEATMLRLTQGICATVVLVAFSTLTSPVYADGKDWNDGPVINVASIRTVDGHFDDYMHWLATTYKKQQEAAKKAGLITAYRVIVVEARGPNDPDILLVTEFKNWAALDHLGSKFDQVSAQIEGSVEAAAKSEAERAKIRTVLGSRTEQEAILK